MAKSPDSETPTIEVSFEDILAGRAYIRLSPIARLLLLHWMGAPWNEKIPDAVLHPLQVEVILHKEREKIVHGGSRLGKSVLGGGEAACELMLPGSKTAVVAQRYDHVGAEWQYVYKSMRELFSETPSALNRLVFKHQANYHDYDAETMWGSRARGYSVESDEGAALLGQEFSRIVVGEGSHVSVFILERRIVRAIDGWLMQSTEGMVREGGYLSLYTTPKGFEGCSAAEYERVTKERRKRGEDCLDYGNCPFAATVWIREASVIENPYYDLKVYKARKKSLSAEAGEEQYDGKMTFATGRIYRGYRDFKHIRALPSPEAIKLMQLGVGIDTGAYTGIVLVGLDREHRFHVLGETYTEQRTINETLLEFREMVSEVLGPAFGTHDFDMLKDAVGVWGVDPASQHKLEIMEDLDITLGIPMALAGGKLELLPSIEIVDDWFRSDRIYLAEDHTDVLADMLSKYIWKTMKATQRGNAKAPTVKEPRKEYDHLLDALRFILMMLEAEGPREEPPPVLTQAEAWKRARNEVVQGPLREILAKAKDHKERFGVGISV